MMVVSLTMFDHHLWPAVARAWSVWCHTSLTIISTLAPMLHASQQFLKTTAAAAKKPVLSPNIFVFHLKETFN